MRCYLKFIQGESAILWNLYFILRYCNALLHDIWSNLDGLMKSGVENYSELFSLIPRKKNTLWPFIRTSSFKPWIHFYGLLLILQRETTFVLYCLFPRWQKHYDSGTTLKEKNQKGNNFSPCNFSPLADIPGSIELLENSLTFEGVQWRKIIQCFVIFLLLSRITKPVQKRVFF